MVSPVDEAPAAARHGDLTRMQMRTAVRLVRDGIGLSNRRNEFPIARGDLIRLLEGALRNGPGPEWDEASRMVGNLYWLSKAVAL